MKLKRAAIILTTLVLAGCAAPAMGSGGAVSGMTSSTQPPDAAAPADTTKVGTDIGDRAPGFSVTSLDGGQVSDTDMRAEGKPYLLYFYATWCTVCRAELRFLKSEWPSYSDRVGFLAVGIDPTENADALRAYDEQQGFPWPAALGNPQIIESYRVISTSIKYAVDRNGLVLYRRGYGVGSEQGWRDLLQQLAAS